MDRDDDDDGGCEDEASSSREGESLDPDPDPDPDDPGARAPKTKGFLSALLALTLAPPPPLRGQVGVKNGVDGGVAEPDGVVGVGVLTRFPRLSILFRNFFSWRCSCTLFIRRSLKSCVCTAGTRGADFRFCDVTSANTRLTSASPWRVLNSVSCDSRWKFWWE